MKYIIEKINTISDNEIDKRFYCADIESKYLLTISSKKYLLNYDDDVIEVIQDEIICINNWSNLSFLSAVTGDVVYLSGLNGAFVGLTALQNDILIVSDFSLFLVNKEHFYPWNFQSVTDNILSYQILNEFEVKLNTATEGEKVLKIYSL